MEATYIDNDFRLGASIAPCHGCDENVKETLECARRIEKVCDWVTRALTEGPVAAPSPTTVASRSKANLPVT